MLDNKLTIRLVMLFSRTVGFCRKTREILAQLCEDAFCYSEAFKLKVTMNVAVKETLDLVVR